MTTLSAIQVLGTKMRVTLVKADFERTLQMAQEQGGADLVFTSPPY